MWRHEDIWRVLGGGIDFETGEPLDDEYDQSKQAAAGPPMIRFPIPPLMHGARSRPPDGPVRRRHRRARAGVRRRRGVADDRQAQREPAVLHRRRDGPPADRRAVGRARQGRGYDLSSLFLFASSAALFSPSIKESCSSCSPTRSSPTPSARRRPASTAPASWPRARRTPAGRGSPSTRPPSCSTRTATRSSPARACAASSPSAATSRSATTRTPRSRRRRSEDRRRPLLGPRRLRPGRGGRHGHAARPRLAIDQHRRGEGLPRGGGDGAQGPPGRVRRAGGRRARRATASASPPWCSPVKAPVPRSPSWTSSCARELAGYKVPRATLAGRRNPAHSDRQGRLPVGQGADRVAAGRRRPRQSRRSRIADAHRTV